MVWRCFHFNLCSGMETGILTFEEEKHNWPEEGFWKKPIKRTVFFISRMSSGAFPGREAEGERGSTDSHCYWGSVHKLLYFQQMGISPEFYFINVIFIIFTDTTTHTSTDTPYTSIHILRFWREIRFSTIYHSPIMKYIPCDSLL